MQGCFQDLSEPEACYLRSLVAVFVALCASGGYTRGVQVPTGVVLSSNLFRDVGGRAAALAEAEKAGFESWETV